MHIRQLAFLWNLLETVRVEVSHSVNCCSMKTTRRRNRNLRSFILMPCKDVPIASFHLVCSYLLQLPSLQQQLLTVVLWVLGFWLWHGGLDIILVIQRLWVQLTMGILFTHVPLSPISVICYQWKHLCSLAVKSGIAKQVA